MQVKLMITCLEGRMMKKKPVRIALIVVSILNVLCVGGISFI